MTNTWSTNTNLIMVVYTKCVSVWQLMAATHLCLLIIRVVNLIGNSEFQFIFMNAKEIYSCLIAQCTLECIVRYGNNSESILNGVADPFFYIVSTRANPWLWPQTLRKTEIY